MGVVEELVVDESDILAISGFESVKGGEVRMVLNVKVINQPTCPDSQYDFGMDMSVQRDNESNAEKLRDERGSIIEEVVGDLIVVNDRVQHPSVRRPWLVSTLGGRMAGLKRISLQRIF